MSFKDIKKRLYDDHSFFKLLLEEIGIHHIRLSKRYIQGALPDGDNETSLCIKIKDDNLYTDIFTRSDYKGKDIIDAISYITGKKDGELSKWLHKITNIKYQFSENNRSSSFLDAFVKYDKFNGNNFTENKVLNESTKNMFIPYGHSLLAEEDIEISTQDEFEVMYDILDSRIVFPFRDEDGQIITFLGRTILDTKDIKTPKYLSYYPFNGHSLLFGLYKTKKYIKEKNECIIVEAPKSVMKAWQMDCRNVVALNKKKISPCQYKMLLSMDCDNFVLALDKDVDIDEVKLIAEQFEGLKNISIIIDTNGLLNKNDSPFDQGEMVWDELYEERIFI